MFYLKNICLASIIIITSGCMSPPVRWHYKTSSDNYQPLGGSLLIQPIEDKRELKNESKSLLGNVPLVLWTTEHRSAFDLILSREGTKYQSVPAGGLRFVATEDLKQSIAQELGHGRVFSPVFSSKNESGPWAAAGKEYTLQLTINELSLTNTHYSYGLGPLSFAANLFGAPQKCVTLAINWDISVYNEKSQSVYKDTVSSKRSFTDGWYYSLDAEQRALDEISFSLYESLIKLQKNITNNQKI